MIEGANRLCPIRHRGKPVNRCLLDPRGGMSNGFYWLNLLFLTLSHPSTLETQNKVNIPVFCYLMLYCSAAECPQ